MSILAPEPSNTIGVLPFRKAPSPPAEFILGHMRGMRGNAAKYMMSLHGQYGDVVRLRFGPLRAHVFFHPDHVQHILSETSRIFEGRSGISQNSCAGGSRIADGRWRSLEAAVQSSPARVHGSPSPRFWGCDWSVRSGIWRDGGVVWQRVPKRLTSRPR